MTHLAHFVGSLGCTPGTTFPSLRVDRLALRETEPMQLKWTMVL
jgi:hypothetical protein